MVIDHRLLYRMQVAVVSQALNRDQFFSVKRRQKLDAGVDGANRETVSPTIEFGKNDRARAAVSLGTTFLRASPAEIFAQELQNRSSRVDVLEFDDFAIENKPDRVGLRVDASYPGTSSSSTGTPVAAHDISGQPASKSE